MKVSDLLKELEESDYYKKFKVEYSDSFFSAGFFILDLDNKSETLQLDFFLPKEQKVAAFEFPWNIPKIHKDDIKTMDPQSLENLNFDIDDLERKATESITKNNSKLKPTKIIAVLKSNEWNLTCMDNTLGIIRIKFNALTGAETYFNSDSLMNLVRTEKK
ncbi:MAG: hypothetical protein IH845_05440 [Nanoarchaeota archaeon]|nr:hypothetical protein [Nanoarchaeota archaeon]